MYTYFSGEHADLLQDYQKVLDSNASMSNELSEIRKEMSTLKAILKVKHPANCEIIT